MKTSSLINRVFDEGEVEQWKSLNKKRGLVEEYRKLLTKLLRARMSSNMQLPTEQDFSDTWALRRAYRDGAAYEDHLLLMNIGDK
jgi:hypothetical protein